MALTQTYINEIINKAQQRMAEWGNDIVDLENRGECALSIYLKFRYLSAGINVLQSDVDDLTSDQKDDIISCMIATGELGELSTSPFTFGATTITVLNLSGSYLGLSDTDNTYSGHKGKVPVVNENENALEFQTIGIGSNNLLVSPFGDDSKAAKGNVVNHYKTLTAAETAASAGDTIIVYPGTYNIGTNTLGKDQVNWNFMAGAVVVNASSGGGSIWNLVSGQKRVVVDGLGEFQQNTSSKYVVELDEATSSLTIRGKLVTNWNNASGHAILKDLGDLYIKDSTIIVTNTSAYAVHGSAASRVVHVYKAESNSSGHSSNVIYRINNILIDPNVS